jgi:O-antigen/teichoic acid export membrane protein
MLQHGLYSLLATGFRLGLSVLSIPLLIQFLGESTYGLYAIVLAIITLAALPESGVAMLVTVFVPAHYEHDPAKAHDLLRLILLLIFCLFIITLAIIWLAAPTIAHFFTNFSIRDQAVVLLCCRLSGVLMLGRLLQQFFIGIEQATGHYALFNAINSAWYGLQTGLLLAGAWWYQAVVPLILIHIVITFLFVFVHAWFCYRHVALVRFNWFVRPDWSHARTLLQYGGRIYLGTVGTSLFSQGDRILVSRLLGLDVAGLYAALTGVAAQLNVLSAIPVQPLVPAISQLISTTAGAVYTPEQRQHILHRVKQATRLNATISVGLGLVLLLLSPEISGFITRRSGVYVEGVASGVRIITAVYTLYSLNAVAYFVLFAIRKEAVNMVVSITCGLFALLLIALLGQRYGLSGALAGNAGYMLTLYLIPKSMGYLRVSVKPIICILLVPVGLFAFGLLVSFFFSGIPVRGLALVAAELILLAWFVYSNKKN